MKTQVGLVLRLGTCTANKCLLTTLAPVMVPEKPTKPTAWVWVQRGYLTLDPHPHPPSPYPGTHVGFQTHAVH
jgi:hypothetical protein